MKRTLPVITGLLLAPICALGLLWQQWFVWILCPHALLVMFLRQSLRAYDSFGAADYPDLIVGVLYYPVIGFLISRALAQDRAHRTAIQIVVCHIVVLLAAVAAGEFRNHVWSVQLS